MEVMTDMLARPTLHRHAGSAAHGGDYDPLHMVPADETLIEEASRRLSEAAPRADIILFGSRARGEARPDSDLDLLVIEAKSGSRTSEFVRLRNAVGEIGVPVDLVVYWTTEADKWAGVPGTFIHEVLKEGRVLAGR
jgi:predicted nucleotidyltransferase